MSRQQVELESPSTDVRGLGTVVGVWAHPDDEAYLSAGLMGAAVDAGNRVVCITATHGELGTPDPALWPPARLAHARNASCTHHSPPLASMITSGCPTATEAATPRTRPTPRR